MVSTASVTAQPQLSETPLKLRRNHTATYTATVADPERNRCAALSPLPGGRADGCAGCARNHGGIYGCHGGGQDER